MSNSISRIYDDIDRYVALCKKFGERPCVDKDGFIDCYSKHSDELEKRNRQDNHDTRPSQNPPKK